MRFNKYRFAKQLRRNDCGPNAIINLMKYMGVKIPYKENYQRLYNYFKIPTYGGTHIADLHMFLVKKKIPKSRLVDVIVNPNTYKIAKLVKSDKAILMAFNQESNKSGHICLMVGVNKKGFQIVNYCTKKTLKTVAFDKFQKEVLDFKKAIFYVYEERNK